MFHEFLTRNRKEFIARCRQSVAKRASPKVTAEELDHGAPFLLDQLIKTLELEQTAYPMASRMVSAPFGEGKHAHSDIGDPGLSIARRSVKSNVGILGARNKARSGCIFTIDPPRHSVPALARLGSDSLDARLSTPQI
jgi:hypothetical protein